MPLTYTGKSQGKIGNRKWLYRDENGQEEWLDIIPESEKQFQERQDLGRPGHVTLMAQGDNLIAPPPKITAPTTITGPSGVPDVPVLGSPPILGGAPQPNNMLSGDIKTLQSKFLTDLSQHPRSQLLTQNLMRNGLMDSAGNITDWTKVAPYANNMQLLEQSVFGPHELPPVTGGGSVDLTRATDINTIMNDPQWVNWFKGQNPNATPQQMVEGINAEIQRRQSGGVAPWEVPLPPEEKETYKYGNTAPINWKAQEGGPTTGAGYQGATGPQQTPLPPFTGPLTPPTTPIGNVGGQQGPITQTTQPGEFGYPTGPAGGLQSLFGPQGGVSRLNIGTSPTGGVANTVPPDGGTGVVGPPNTPVVVTTTQDQDGNTVVVDGQGRPLSNGPVVGGQQGLTYIDSQGNQQPQDPNQQYFPGPDGNYYSMNDASAGAYVYDGAGFSPWDQGEVLGPDQYSPNPLAKLAEGPDQDFGEMIRQLIMNPTNGLLNQVGNRDTGEIEKLVNSILGLSTLQNQNMFQQMFPQGVGAAGDIYNTVAGRTNAPLNMPAPGPLTDYGADAFYQGGQGAADNMDWLLRVARELGIPEETLRDFPVERLMDAERYNIEDPYMMEYEEQANNERNRLESYIAANGMGGTAAQDMRDELESDLARRKASASMAFTQGMGSEQRQDLGSAANILNALYGQRATGTSLGSGKLDQLGNIIGSAEGMDLARRSGEFQRAGATDQQYDQIFQQMMELLMAPENIASQRISTQMAPLSMLLSALSGVNVSPTLAPSLSAGSKPGFGDWLGMTLGQGISNVPFMIK